MNLRDEPEYKFQYEAASAWLRAVYRRAWKEAGRPTMARDSVAIREKTARKIAAANAYCTEEAIASIRSRVEVWIVDKPQLALAGLTPPLYGEPDLSEPKRGRLERRSGIEGGHRRVFS